MKTLLNSILLFAILARFVSCSEQQSSGSITLESSWEFKQEDKNNWMPAQVPGNVHLDLERNSVIENPFYADNEEKYQWIENKDWDYRTTFNLPESVLEHKNIEIEFLGLDTYADVFLNGEKIIASNNMFISYAKEVKKLLREGNNELVVKFRSPISETMPLHEKSAFTYPADNDRSEEHLSVYTRKAPYHYGWDWGPRFVTSGIWRPVKINFWNEVRISNQHIKQEIAVEKATVIVDVELESSLQNKATINLSLNGKKVKSKEIQLQANTSRYELIFEIDNPELWWPNGMGDSYLYDLETSVVYNGDVLDKEATKLGLRTIEVINEKDELGESFYLKVNGIPTFIKGANYIPNDSFLGRVTDSVYEQNFVNAVESNMNMLRVWGGGVYEDDKFYELADEHGIMIWQDFMFACTMYPSDEEFLNNVEKEADYNIKRLRNHASLAMWCGNNEVEVAWDNWGWQDKYNYTEDIQKELLDGYDALFNKLLPAKVEELDPSKFYYPSSPISNWGNKADLKIADNHYWGVWWGKHEFEKLNEYVPRFMSEFGFQSFPSMKTIASFAEEKDWQIESDIMNAHQKSSIGNVTIKEYMQRDYKMPENFEDFVYLNQVMQAEGMRIGFEAHRRNKPFNMGSLYWQLNDVWPVVSWSGIDYYGRWKAMQYFVKKSFEPIISSAYIDNDKLKINLISDILSATTVDLKIQVLKLDGTVVWEKQHKLVSPANSNEEVLTVELSEILGSNKTNEVVLLMESTYGDKNIQSTFLFDKVKNLKLEKADINIEREENKAFVELKISSDKFVKNLELEADIEGKWSDNYFDIIPGKEYQVRFTPANSDEKPVIKTKSVIDTY